MRRFLPALVLGTIAGCYTAEFDETADKVFACTADDECDAAFSCIGGVCVSDEGPTLSIVGPEEDSVFPAGEAVVFSLTLSGADLKLAEPNGAHVAGEGYLIVEVDGQELPSPIIDGSLSGTVSQNLDLGVLEGGYHRLRVKAIGLDNEAYSNPSAVADIGIWVNDDLPHIGIRTPWPGDSFPAGEGLDVSVGCLNCTFIDPELAASDRVDDPVPEGHTHVFFDRREDVSGTLDFPACLPDCNFQYANNGSIKPSGEANQRRVEGVVLQVPTKAGALKVTASLNYTGHFPYPSDNLDPAMWEAMPELKEQLVYDSVTIELHD